MRRVPSWFILILTAIIAAIPPNLAAKLATRLSFNSSPIVGFAHAAPVAGVGGGRQQAVEARDFVLAAAGDIACGSGSFFAACRDRETSDLLLQVNPDVVLALGDNQYEFGLYNDFLNFYDKSWGRVKFKTRPTTGNHEYELFSADGYFDYFNGVGNFTGSAGDRDKGYYSFDLGNWHLIALNSNCSRVGGCNTGSLQERWLRADLAAHPNSCILAYWHHPRFSSGQHGGSLEYQALWQALYDSRADVVLVGHDHDYERFAAQTPSGALDSQRGIRQFVVGTGGRDLTTFALIVPNSEVRDSRTFGVLKLALHSGSYEWEFIPITGGTFRDSGSGFCHNTQQQPEPHRPRRRP
ncbi:MAG TPA: metallophosphoesterase [Acidobacteriota bacterium]|jgi:hypothetical protein